MDRKAQIFNTAIKLFSENGLDIPTSRIAKEAGISNGTLFNYFATKQTLIDELYLSIKEEVVEGLMSNFDVSLSTKEAFFYIWKNYISWALENIKKHNVSAMLKSSNSITEQAHYKGEEYFMPVFELISNAIENDDIIDVSVEFICLNAFAQLNSAIHYIDQFNPKEDYISKSFEIYWNGIKQINIITKGEKMLSNYLSNMMFKPYQSPVFDNPSDYGLEYEDVTFKASDGTSLSGWLIKGDKDKVIIQSHFGTMCSRSGFTLEGKGFMKPYERDIHFLNQAKYLNDAGYTVLMYDFRNHGKSGQGNIPWVTWGMEEAKDVIAAVDYISNHADYKDASIGLLSICMGQGATVNAFGADSGLRNYPNIKTMISVQPMDYCTFVKVMGLPKFLQNGVTKNISKKTGLDFSKNSFMQNVKSINVPVLVIQNKNDGYLDENLIETYYNNLPVEKEMLWIEIPKKKNANFNRLAAYEWIGNNSNEITGWFAKYIK